MRKMTLLAICGLVMLGIEVKAQQAAKCATSLLLEQKLVQNPEYRSALEHHRLHLQQQDEQYLLNTAPAGTQKTTNTVTIPVVFHVVVTQSQLDYLGGVDGVRTRMLSQIDVLNKDYSGTNSDSSNIPAPFKPLFDHGTIQFAPAHRKPDGSGTEGFEIKITTINSFSAFTSGGSDVKSSFTGGLDAWDPEKYLNIWVTNLSESSILGFAIPPSFINFGFTPEETGVVLRYSLLGRQTSSSQNFYPAKNNLGRTATHEIGHFFELAHIFGENSSCPNNGDVDDGIADTPPQASETYSNITCPPFPKTDICTPTGNGIMWMNFMDYVDDACMYMFTKGQGVRMMNQLKPGGPSYSLTQHPEVLSWPTDVANIELAAGLHIFPNPATGRIQVSFADASGLKEIAVVNLLSQKVYSIAVDNPNISKYDVDLTTQPKGIYLVQCTFATGTVTKKIVLQ